MMNIDPGELNQRVEIYAFESIPDGMGGSTRTAIKRATVWAKVMSQRGAESQQAGRVQPVMSYVFVIRANAGLQLSADSFFRWHGRDFNIRFFPDVVKQEQFLFVEAETGVAQ